MKYDQRVAWIGCCILGGFVAGCSTPPQPTATATSRPRLVTTAPASTNTADLAKPRRIDRDGRPTVVVAGGATPPAAADSKGDSADALAKRTEQHARAIENLLHGRAADEPPPEPPAASELPAAPTPPPAVAAPAPMTPAAAVTLPPPSPATPNTAADANASASVAAAPPSRDNAKPANVAPIAAAVGNVPADLQPPPAGETLEARLARRASEYPRDLASQMDHQLARYLQDDPVPAAGELAQLPAEDRDVLTTLLDGLVNFRTGVRNDSNQLIGKKIRPLVEMADRLRARSDLSVPNAAICKKIDGFGVYTPFEQARFTAGQVNRFAVYCEIENLSAQLNAAGKWESRVQEEITLYNDAGRAVWSNKTPYVDTNRNRRRDFFLGSLVELPATVPVGMYTLKISVIDQQSSRVAETSLPVELVAG